MFLFRLRPVNLGKFLRLTFLQNASGRQLYVLLEQKNTSLQAEKNKVDIIYCYVPIRNSYKIWFLDFLAQRKSGVKLLKDIFKCFFIDVGFTSCLTLIVGPILSLFCNNLIYGRNCKKCCLNRGY